MGVFRHGTVEYIGDFLLIGGKLLPSSFHGLPGSAPAYQKLFLRWMLPVCLAYAVYPFAVVSRGSEE